MNMLLAFTPDGEATGLYGPDKENYSPMNSPAVDVGSGFPGIPAATATHRLPAILQGAGGGPALPVAVVPAPPSPSTGGVTGPTQQLGWTFGIRRDRSMHQPFTGMALRGVPNAPNPRTGNVGLFDSSNRRAAGVGALLNDYTPTNAAVSAMFAGSVRPSAIADEVAALR